MIEILTTKNVIEVHVRIKKNAINAIHDDVSPSYMQLSTDNSTARVGRRTKGKTLHMRIEFGSREYERWNQLVFSRDNEKNNHSVSPKIPSDSRAPGAV